MIKTALIAGGWLWDAVGAGEISEEVILGCVRTKLQVVGARTNVMAAVGRSSTWATRSATPSRPRLLIGATATARLWPSAFSPPFAFPSAKRFATRSRELLESKGLPTHLQDCSVDAVLRAVTLDKKRDGEGVPFVLVDAPGEVHEGNHVADDAVRAAVEELAA